VLAVVAAVVIGGMAIGVLIGALSTVWGYAAGLIGFFAVGGAVIAHYAKSGLALSPLPMVTGLFILEFAVGGIFYHNPRPDSVLYNLMFAYTSTSLETTVLVAFGAWVLIVVGYFLGGALSRPLTSIPRPQVNSTLTGVAVLLLVAGWIARLTMIKNGWYFHITDGRPAAVSGWRNLVVVVAGFPLLATGLIGARYYRERPSDRVLFWALVVTEALWAIPSGERSRLFTLGVFLVILRAYSSTRFPLKGALVLALIAVLVVFPLGAAYRSSSGTVTGYQSDSIGQLRGAASETIDTYLSEPLAGVEDGLNQTVRRLAGVASVAAMVEQGASRYPSSPDEAAGIYAGAIVPRAVLPTKTDPTKVPVDFGHQYGITVPGNTASVTVTSVGDLWGTFGPAGLVIGMLILGALVRAMATYFRDLRSDNYAVVALYGAILVPFLLAFETTIAVGFLQTLRELAVYVVALAVAGVVVRTWNARRGRAAQG
jgi:Flp pilus assembly pilin Flp